MDIPDRVPVAFEVHRIPAGQRNPVDDVIATLHTDVRGRPGECAPAELAGRVRILVVPEQPVEGALRVEVPGTALLFVEVEGELTPDECTVVR